MSKFYQHEAKGINGQEINFEKYKGKVVLVVNTASKCGLTPQYEGLQKLHEKYKDRGLEILGFPCDQFGHQEPGDEKEIAEGCLVNYGVDFQMFSKIEVNGKNAHPLFQYLRKEKGGFLNNKIKWNFTKFLINKDGEVIERFAPTTTPSKIEPKLKRLLED